MRLLFAITIFSFCALAWAALAIARHVRRDVRRRDAGGNGAAPGAPAAISAGAATATARAQAAGPAAGVDPTLAPSPLRKLRVQTPQRHDRTYASADSGDLHDPGARAQTRPRRIS